MQRNSTKLLEDADERHLIFKQKSLSGFSGGFKIPEEVRQRNIDKRKYQKPKQKESEDEEAKKDFSTVNRDEILQELNLGSADTGFGGGKGG